MQVGAAPVVVAHQIGQVGARTEGLARPGQNGGASVTACPAQRFHQPATDFLGDGIESLRSVEGDHRDITAELVVDSHDAEG